MKLNEIMGQPREGYQYVTDCVSSAAEPIQDMIDRAKQITYESFVKVVDQNDLRRVFHYDWSRQPQRLTMKGDYHVKYYRSKYKGRPCVYAVHSAIEYVFCPGGQALGT